MNLYIHFIAFNKMSETDNIVENISVDDVKQINEECVNTLTSKLNEIKLEYDKILNVLDDVRQHLVSKSDQLENLMCAVQSYSGSMHVAINRTTATIEALNNNISNGIPRNGSSNKSMSVASNASSMSSVSNNRVSKRAVSINVLFSQTFRLFEGDNVIEAPDLASIIEKYESNNKINLREIMDINNLLDDNERAKFDDSWNKLKKESDKTPKKKASLVWGIVKNNKEFHRKFEAFKTHFCESSENKV